MPNYSHPRALFLCYWNVNNEKHVMQELVALKQQLNNNKQLFNPFWRAPSVKHYGVGISMVSMQISQHYKKTKMASRKFRTFYGIRTLGEHIFAHSP